MMDPPDINAAMNPPSVPVLSSFVDFCKDLLYKLNTISNTMTPSDINDTISASSVQVASSFPKFSLLPKEIQLKIWFQALPEGKMFYATEHGIYPPSQLHALHDVSFESREVFLKHYKRLGTHTTGCYYAKWNKAPIFYSPLEDTIICEADSSRTSWLYSSGNKLLYPDLLCCDGRKRFFAELRHVGVLADRHHYGLSAAVAYLNDAFDSTLMLRDENMSLYAELFTTFPMLESFSFVIGSNAVQKRTREVPGRRFVHYSKEAILEEIHREKTEEIRNTIEKWKATHPEFALLPTHYQVSNSAEIMGIWLSFEGEDYQRFYLIFSVRCWDKFGDWEGRQLCR
ncbi:hypothetical protein BPAE_0003g00160 [Botrytis paeoniae]|uniref:2EXR domain-containing protein n=1 Tax=Botrytis paeoniae TaxID=278948 RepID=A0A4Z1G921_9HELO|nr:hypothetical protein BPAE_0003g00160 [Botrytis paeoniae]